MSKRTNRIVAGAIRGMAGGAVMALAFTAIRRIDWNQVPVIRDLNQNDYLSLVQTSSESQPEEAGTLGKRVLVSALLGGLYGALRSAFQLPGLISGPIFGLASYPLSWIGLGPAAENNPGPWKETPQGLLPRLVTHSLYGMVTDQVSERFQDLLA